MTAREWSLPLEVDDEPEVMWRLLREIDCAGDTIVRFRHDGDPKSKARARVVNGHAYTPKDTVTAERVLAAATRQRLPRGWSADSECGYGLFAVFFTATRQRRDVDNMVKLVSDALTGVVWVDDSQVTEVSARVVRADPFPRTHLWVYQTNRITRMSTMECGHCGKRFDVYPGTTRKYCSSECANNRRRTGRTFEKACQACGKTFTAPSTSSRACSKECRHILSTAIVACIQCSAQFRKPKSWVKKVSYCSRECQAAASRGKRLARNAGVCADCQGPTSKKSCTRCQACSHAHQAITETPKRQLRTAVDGTQMALPMEPPTTKGLPIP